VNMRSIPERLMLSVAVAAVCVVAPISANASSSTASVVGPLKLCTYSTGDVNEGSQALFVKIVAVGGGGVRGTLRVRSTGLDKTVPFRLKKGGIGLIALPLTPPMELTLTTRLILKPVNPTRTDHVSFAVTDPSAPAPRGHSFGFTNRPTRPAEPFACEVPPCGTSLARNSSRVRPGGSSLASRSVATTTKV